MKDIRLAVNAIAGVHYVLGCWALGRAEVDCVCCIARKQISLAGFIHFLRRCPALTCHVSRGRVSHVTWRHPVHYFCHFPSRSKPTFNFQSPADCIFHSTDCYCCLPPHRIDTTPLPPSSVPIRPPSKLHHGHI